MVQVRFDEFPGDTAGKPHQNVPCLSLAPHTSDVPTNGSYLAALATTRLRNASKALLFGEAARRGAEQWDSGEFHPRMPEADVKYR